MTSPTLELRDLRVTYTVRGIDRQVLRGVSLSIAPGESYGLVGESGCGKTTVGRLILRLIEPTGGSVLFEGVDISKLSGSQLKSYRREAQIVFQDPLASLDPRMTVGEIVAEPLRVHARDLSRAERRERVIDILARVGLPADVVNRYPHEFSGGQCQRIGIARAMVLRPKLLVCDEPVSALDVSIQAQIVNLLQDLKRDFGMTILFVSHNLAVVRRLCDRVLVLYLGKPMELASTDLLYSQPRHPYTQGLLAAVPVPDPDLQPQRLGGALGGELPSPMAPPSGCVFRTRCAHAVAACAAAAPRLQSVETGHEVACDRWREISASGAVA